MPEALRVLDVVRLADHPVLVRDGLAGRLAVVTVVRLMDTGELRYEVTSKDRADDDCVPGVYDHDVLAPTGERVTAASLNRLPAGLCVRDVATVASGPDVAEDLRGRGVVVDGGIRCDDTGRVLVSVWVPALAEHRQVPAECLRPTGERTARKPLGRHLESYRVNEQGALCGEHGYTVLDELDQYL